MKPKRMSYFSRAHQKPCPGRALAACASSVACFVALNFGLQAQTDNFDSGTDAGWSKITSAGFPATYSFPADDFGGHAYRLQGDLATGGGDTARAVAYRTERLYTNFFVAADIVGWDSSLTNDLVLGLIARGNNISSGAIDGVTFTTRINRFTASDGQKGQVQVYSFFLGGVGVASSQDFFTTLLPGRKYRFVFTGVDNIFSGAIYDLEDLTHPLVSMSGDDSGGPFTFPASGYVGIFNYSYPGNKPTDTTFDNFVAAELPPTTVNAPATPHGLTGAPQVVNRSPASHANFYPAVNGITFNATTLTATNGINTNAIRLYLNGFNVSSALNISGPVTNALVTYNGLTSNAVYDARIELQDALGRKTTNVFTFDTFTDAYLASAAAKNIECEDYDYTDGSSDGLFIDNPLPSGLTTNGSAINASGGGYYGLQGLNASSGGLDFYTPDGSADGNWNEFRSLDAIRTLQGNRNFGYYSGGNILYDRTYDTQRKKYSNADPALEEYEIVQTRDGNWMNYTRIFSTNGYYNVYLRHASAFTEQLSLDQIGAGPTTNNLGTFSTTNALGLNNYRYAPLRDASNRLAVVNLSRTNVVRLTILGDVPNRNATRYGLCLNYLAFVPALLVESAAQVTGPWSIETNASVEPGTRHITLPQSGGTRFYRLRWDHAVRIMNIRMVGANVELTYQ